MMTKHITAILILLVTLSSTVWSDDRTIAEVRPLPKGAENITLTPMNKEGAGPLTLASLRGKYVYLDFWASWCIPCRASFQFYQKLNEAYQSKGLVIVAVNSEDDLGAAQAFLKSYNVSFLCVRDQGTSLAGLMQLPKMPSAFIIDPQGQIVYSHAGFFPEDTAVIESKIKQLLGIK